jgi:ribonuclease R
MVDGMTRRRGLDPATWRWDPGARSLATWLGGLPTTGPHARIAAAVHRQALLATGAAAFTDVPGRHHGVGADVYARFTAPMREIVGVFVHKETWERLGVDAPAGNTHDEALREQVVEASNQAKVRQRALDGQANRLVIDQLLGDDLRRPARERPERAGTVMGIGRDKVHVLLDDPPIDLKVYLAHQGERVRRTADGLAVVRERDGAVWCEVGDAVSVRVRGADRERDRVALSLRRTP